MSSSMLPQQLLVSASVKGSPFNLLKLYDISNIKSTGELEARVLCDLRAQGVNLRYPSRSRPQGLTIKASYDTVFTPASKASLKTICSRCSGQDHGATLLLVGSEVVAACKAFPYDLTEHYGLSTGIPLEALRAVAAKQLHDHMRAVTTTNNTQIAPAACGHGGCVGMAPYAAATEFAIEPLAITVWTADTVYELEVQTGVGRVPVDGLHRSSTVRELKALVEALAGFPTEDQVYQWRGAELDDHTRLCDAHVTDTLSLHMRPAADKAAAAAAPCFEISIRTLTGRSLALEGVWRGSSVEEVKARIHRLEGICPDRQRLIFAGAQLQEGRTLADYRVGPGSTLHLVLRPAHGAHCFASGARQGFYGASAPDRSQAVRVLLPSGGELAVASRVGETWKAFAARVRAEAWRAALQAGAPAAVVAAEPGCDNEVVDRLRRSKRLRGEAPGRDGADGAHFGAAHRCAGSGVVVASSTGGRPAKLRRV